MSAVMNPGPGTGAADVLPFTGISTIPLAVAGLVAVVFGTLANRFGRKRSS